MQLDKYERRERIARLMLGWFGIVLSAYLFSFIIGLLTTGTTKDIPQIASAFILTFFGGILVLRSKPADKLKPFQ